MAAEPMVVIHLKANGDFDVLACGDVRVIWVDDGEHAQADRIFEQRDHVSPSAILQLLGPEAVGATLAPKPRAAPTLRLVPKEPVS